MYVRASYHILARRSSDFECQNLCKSAFFEAYLFHWSAFEGPGRRKPEYQACMYRLSQTSPCRENKGLLYRYTDKISAQIQILRGSQILRNSSKIPFLLRVTCCTTFTSCTKASPRYAAAKVIVHRSKTSSRVRYLIFEVSYGAKWFVPIHRWTCVSKRDSGFK